MLALFQCMGQVRNQFGQTHISGVAALLLIARTRHAGTPLGDPIEVNALGQALKSQIQSAVVLGK